MDFGSIRCQEVSAMVRLLVDPNQVQSSSGNGSRKKGQSGSQKLVLAVEKKAT
jgi:hypothetical protein